MYKVALKGADSTLYACAARNNLQVVRFFGFPALRGFNLQTRPGQYTEQAFVGIDRVIASASDHGCVSRACAHKQRTPMYVQLPGHTCLLRSKDWEPRLSKPQMLCMFLCHLPHVRSAAVVCALARVTSSKTSGCGSCAAG